MKSKNSFLWFLPLFAQIILQMSGCATGVGDALLGQCGACQDPAVDNCQAPTTTTRTPPVCSDPTINGIGQVSNPDCGGNGSLYECNPQTDEQGRFIRLDEVCPGPGMVNWVTDRSWLASFDADVVRQTNSRVLPILRSSVGVDPNNGPLVNYLGIKAQWRQLSDDSDGQVMALEGIVENSDTYASLVADNRSPEIKRLWAPHHALCTLGKIKALCIPRRNRSEITSSGTGSSTVLNVVIPDGQTVVVTPPLAQCMPGDDTVQPPPTVDPDPTHGHGSTSTAAAPSGGIGRFNETVNWNVGGSNTAGVRSRNSAAGSAASVAGISSLAPPSSRNTSGPNRGSTGSSGGTTSNPSGSSDLSRNGLLSSDSGGGSLGSGGLSTSSGGLSTGHSSGDPSLQNGLSETESSVAAAKAAGGENYQSAAGSGRGASKSGSGANSLAGIFGSLGGIGGGAAGGGDANGAAGASSVTFSKNQAAGGHAGASGAGGANANANANGSGVGADGAGGVSDQDFQRMLEANSVRSLFETVNRRYFQWGSQRAAEEARARLAH